MKEILDLSKTIYYDEEENTIYLLNQFLLPSKKEVLKLTNLSEVYTAIEKMYICGVNLINVCVAYGLVMVLKNITTNNALYFLGQMRITSEYLCEARPSVRSIRKTLSRIETAVKNVEQKSIENMKCVALAEAKLIHQEDINASEKLALQGLPFIKDSQGVLTCGLHGKLSSSGEYGIGLAPLYIAKRENINIPIYVTEERPFFSGSRILAYELEIFGLSHQIICDNMISTVMMNEKIDTIVLSGYEFDENGNLLSGAGALNLAIIAKYFGVKSYAFIPKSLKFNDSLNNAIVENRLRKVYTDNWFKRQIAQSQSNYYGCATDIIPNDLITAIATEDGILS